MEVNADVLRQRYSTMETEALIELQWKEELTELALGVLDEVLKSRGVPDEMRAELTKQFEEKTRPELPFSWGKFVIFIGFFQGSIALVFGGIFGIKTEYLPNIIYSIILGLILLSYAYGLMKRKRWGLNILMVALYISIALCIFLFISGIFEGSIESIIQGIGGGVITFLNIVYFRKRKTMFK